MILIEKKMRRLTLFAPGGQKRLECAVCLGAHPEGPKRAEGDGRTPEGEYRVCTVNMQSKYKIALGLDYPNAQDARRALREGRIRRLDALRIQAARALRVRPPWRTPLGGFVMLHGESPEGRTGDWTAGCVALSNNDIQRLAKLCGKGERVRIVP